MIDDRSRSPRVPASRGPDAPRNPLGPDGRPYRVWYRLRWEMSDRLTPEQLAESMPEGAQSRAAPRYATPPARIRHLPICRPPMRPQMARKRPAMCPLANRLHHDRRGRGGGWKPGFVLFPVRQPYGKCPIKTGHDGSAWSGFSRCFAGTPATSERCTAFPAAKAPAAKAYP